MKSSHRGAPASPLTPSGVESSVSHGRRPLRESLDIRALPPSRRPRPSRERQTGVTGRFPVRRAEPTFLADEMSAPADFQVNDAVSEERTSGRSNALSVRTSRKCHGTCTNIPLTDSMKTGRMIRGVVRHVLGQLIAPDWPVSPVSARHALPSWLYSADDEASRPSDRLLETAVRCIDLARSMDLADISNRIPPPLVRYPDV